MGSDLVSIIVPVYNAELYLNECIDSIINQTYKNLEIILIDDGSSDNSYSIMKEYANKDNRIVCLTQNNFGAPSARNKGIDISNGKYIMFFDSDDVLFDDAINNLLSIIGDSDIAIGNYKEISEANEFLVDRTYFDTDNVYPINNNFKRTINYDTIPGNKLYKSDIIKNNHIYFDNVRVEQDTNFYIKYIYFVKMCSVTNKFIFNYRITNNSISRIHNLNILDVILSLNLSKKFLQSHTDIKIDDTNFEYMRLLHYRGKVNKAKYYNKTYRNIVLTMFYDEVKKINVKSLNKNDRKYYYDTLLRCKVFKYGILIKVLKIKSDVIDFLKKK